MFVSISAIGSRLKSENLPLSVHGRMTQSDIETPTAQGVADAPFLDTRDRVETLFPVEDEGISNYIVHEVLEAYLRDNVKARILHPDGTYSHVKPSPDTQPFDVQASLATQVGSETDVAVSISALPRKYRKYLSGYEQQN